MMHNQQRQNYVVHKLFNSVQAYIARPQNREVRGPSQLLRLWELSWVRRIHQDDVRIWCGIEILNRG